MLEWNKLLMPLRLGKEGESLPEQELLGRTHFQRDYDRLIFSSPFRRLQNKTQVFPLPGSVFVHNRLTHSLEVASVGRSLGAIVSEKLFTPHNSSVPHYAVEVPIIVATACLAHDLGNPPFGHSGEDAIRHFFKQSRAKFESRLTPAELSDLEWFEGNANSLRLLTHTFKGRRSGGFGLSYATLASLVKYPWESTSMPEGKKKYGYFQAEKALFEQVASTMGLKMHNGESSAFCRHPLVYLVEAADDICYNIMDLEDAHKLSILSSEKVMALLMAFFEGPANAGMRDKISKTLKTVTDSNEQVSFLRALVISRLVDESGEVFIQNLPTIMAGEPFKPLLKGLSPESSVAIKTISQFSVKEIYNHRTVVEIELAGFKILTTLLEIFTNALLNPESDYSRKLLTRIPEQYDLGNESLYLNLLSIVDFVSGMTDTYALELYQNLTGISIPGISKG